MQKKATLRWPVLAGAVTLALSFSVNLLAMLVWDLLEGCPSWVIVALILGPPVVVFFLGWSVSWIWQMHEEIKALRVANAEMSAELSSLRGKGRILIKRSRTIRELTMKVRRFEEELVDARNDYTQSRMAKKQDIAAIEKRREVEINVDGEKDTSRTIQLLKRKTPGPPITDFPVILHTDRQHLDFKDLGYRITPPSAGHLHEWERVIFGKMVIFVLHNKLRVPITHEQTTMFTHETFCDLDSPAGDWIGVETSGAPTLIAISILFPQGWSVQTAFAYKGAPPDSKDIVETVPRIEQRAGAPNSAVLRDRIVWEERDPEPNTTYFVKWTASRIPSSVQGDAGDPPPPNTSMAGSQPEWPS